MPLDDPRKPMMMKLTPNNIWARTTTLERAQNLPSGAVEALDEFTNNLGNMYAGNFISPVYQDVEPTSTGFTGSFVSAVGYIFNGVTYQVGAVAAGVLGVGFNTAGQLVAGAGNVFVDANGIVIISDAFASPNYVNKIKFISPSDDVTVLGSLTTMTVGDNYPTMTQYESATEYNTFYKGTAANASYSALQLVNGSDVNDIIGLSASILVGGERRINLYGGNLYFNAAMSDYDFKVSGDTVEYLLYADGGADAVCVGTTDTTGEFNIGSTTKSSMTQTRFTDTAAAGAGIQIRRARNTQASPNIVQDGDNLGIINWQGFDGVSNYRVAAAIQCLVDGDPCTAGDLTDMPGRLSFQTSPNGTSVAVEHMVINNGGDIVLNSGGLSTDDLTWKTDNYNGIFGDASNESIVIMSNAAGKVSFFGATAIAQPSAYTQTYSTASKTNPTATAANLATTAATQTTPWGFASQAQADAIATQVNAMQTDYINLQKVVNALIDDLQALGLVA